MFTSSLRIKTRISIKLTLNFFFLNASQFLHVHVLVLLFNQAFQFLYFKNTNFTIPQLTLNISFLLRIISLSQCQPSPMASFRLLCLFLSLLSLSSSPSFSLNLRRPISSQSNGLDLLSFSYTTLSSLNLDRPSLVADDIRDLLQRYGFPKGLLPNNVKSYTLSDDGDFTVDLASSCYVTFPDQIVFYEKRIYGKLSYGSVKDVRGIKAQEAFLWIAITAMKSDPSSGTIVFSVGFVSKTLPASMFENILSCSRRLNLHQAS